MLALLLVGCANEVSTPPVDTGGDTVTDTAPPDTGEEDTSSKALCAILRLDDVNADGRDDSGYRSQIDAAGNLLLKEYTDGSGVADTRVTYTYDAMDDLLTQVDDLDADGVADVTYTWTYDAAGNELTQVTTGLWGADHAWSYSYDADGRVLIGEYDGYGEPADGVVDERDEFVYDTAGNLLIATYDYDVDGVADLTVTWTWDADGRALTEAWDYELVDEWGTPYSDYGFAYTYDADGNVLVVTHDVGLDGATADVWTYTYDGDGNVLTATTDYSGDGVIDTTDTYTYDADGNVLSRASEGEYATTTWEYTWVDGRLTRMDVARDGALSWWQAYAHDAAGDITEMVEYDATDDPDYRETYSYDCD